MRLLAPRSRRYNELIGFGISLAFLLLLYDDPVMRGELVALLERPALSELSIRIIVIVIAAGVVVSAFVLVFNAIAGVHKTPGDVESIPIVVIAVNLAAGGFSVAHHHVHEPGLGQLIPLISVLVILYEGYVVSGAGRPTEYTDPGETTRWHVLAVGLLVVTLFWHRHLVTPYYWADALSIAIAFIAASCAIVLALAPLKPHGWRLRSRRALFARWEAHGHLREQFRNDRDFSRNLQLIDLPPDRVVDVAASPHPSHICLFVGSASVTLNGHEERLGRLGIRSVAPGTPIRLRNCGGRTASLYLYSSPSPPGPQPGDRSQHDTASARREKVA